MKVAHLCRLYLPKTEVFIYDQIINALETESMVLTRTLENLNLFGGVKTRCISDQLPTSQAIWFKIIHKLLRHSTKLERKLCQQEITSFKPDVFHAHFAVGAIYYNFLNKKFKLPLIVSCYGHDVSSFPHRYFGIGKIFLQRLWQEVDVLLAMSNDMKQDLLALGCPENKIKIHYHGINLDLFKPVNHPSQDSKLRILFVGNFSAEKKGVEDLLRAFASVVQLRSNIELRLVGEGPLRGRYEKLISKLKLCDKVTFAGHVTQSNLQAEFNTAHIFCHPSFTTRNGDKEGIPGTIVQAMATGLPIVSTLHAGIPEIVENNKHGFLVPERSITAITNALIRLIDDQQLREQMGQAAAMQAVQCADARKQALQLQNIYQEVLNNSK